MRIGIGYDIHKLIKGRPLVLGGVRIPCPRGLQGHSDADALLHAVCDALLGAAAAGDIGEHFPDDDPKYKDADSGKLLRKVCSIIGRKGYAVSNVDTVIIAQEPKLAPFKEAMQERIAEILGIEKNRVAVKAKTNEHLGEVGKGRAIASCAVVLLVNK